MIVNYSELIKNVKGTSVQKPLSGTLSGHAAGEPFDKHVYDEIKKQFPKNTFRQYEYLNDLYTQNSEVIGYAAREKSEARSHSKKIYPSKRSRFTGAQTC